MGALDVVEVRQLLIKCLPLLLHKLFVALLAREFNTDDAFAGFGHPDGDLAAFNLLLLLLFMIFIAVLVSDHFESHFEPFLVDCDRVGFHILQTRHNLRFNSVRVLPTPQAVLACLLVRFEGEEGFVGGYKGLLVAIIVICGIAATYTSSWRFFGFIVRFEDVFLQIITVFDCLLHANLTSLVIPLNKFVHHIEFVVILFAQLHPRVPDNIGDAHTLVRP